MPNRPTALTGVVRDEGEERLLICCRASRSEAGPVYGTAGSAEHTGRLARIGTRGKQSDRTRRPTTQRRTAPYPTEALLKIVVLQQLYGNLSDEEMEYCLLDRMSWQTFTGLTGHRHLPDARTIWAFKELLAQDGGASTLFEIVGEH